jgi:diguanylate cyclase
MSAQKGKPDATLQTARAALEAIMARGQSADPKSFALWYNYAGGDSGLLTEAVNKKLARDGRLTQRDIEELSSAYISSASTPDKVDRLGARISDEIEQVVAMIAAAEGSASNYSANLADVSARLGSTDDRAGVRAIVESLVLATKEMEATNAKLQMQLQAVLEEVARLRREIDEVRKESLTDALTSLGNRKFFNATLEKSVAEAHAASEALSLLLVDVDHFKKINDTYGHVVGDRVLRFVANTLRETLKGRDISARYGGDEFAVILPRTPIPAALAVGEQLRAAVMRGELVKRSTGEKHAKLTISVGVAALHACASAQSLVEAADVCLYAAKRNGRNCVVGESDDRLLEVVAQ